MTRTVSRTYENSPSDSYTEISTGDAPSSAEVSLNSKGQLQWSVKLYYATPDEMHERVERDLLRINSDIRTFADTIGYTLAGK